MIVYIRDGTIDGTGIDEVLGAADLSDLNIESSKPSAITYCRYIFRVPTF